MVGRNKQLRHYNIIIPHHVSVLYINHYCEKEDRSEDVSFCGVVSLRVFVLRRLCALTGR